MIQGPATPILEPMIGLECTLSSPNKKVQYHIVEVAYNAYNDTEIAYLVRTPGSTWHSPSIRRVLLSEITLTEESQKLLIERLAKQHGTSTPEKSKTSNPRRYKEDCSWRG